MARCSNIETAVTESMRIGWRTVGGIIERIQVEIDGQVDRLAGFERIEIDEISYERQTWNGAELARSLAVSEPPSAAIWTRCPTRSSSGSSNRGIPMSASVKCGRRRCMSATVGSCIVGAAEILSDGLRA